MTRTVSSKKNNIIVGCIFDHELKGIVISDKKIMELHKLGIYLLTYQVTKRRIGNE